MVQYLGLRPTFGSGTCKFIVTGFQKRLNIEYIHKNLSLTMHLPDLIHSCNISFRNRSGENRCVFSWQAAGLIESRWSSKSRLPPGARLHSGEEITRPLGGHRAKGSHNVGSTAAPKGNYRGACRLGFRQCNPEILTTCKNESPSLRHRLNEVLAIEKAIKGNIRLASGFSFLSSCPSPTTTKRRSGIELKAE